MKVAIVHDWLIGGGAEKVVLEIHRMFPSAPIYTSYATNGWEKKLNGKVITGYLQNWPFSKLRKFISLLRAWWFSSLDLSEYDLVISSSGAEAKFIKTKPVTTHIAYIHAPTHYYWDRYEQYLKHPGFGVFDWLARIGLKLLVGPMRRWDYKAAQRPEHLIANSNFTKSQIKKYYGRDSTVIHPPVDTEHFKLLNKSSISRSGFVTAGRQTPYKRIDLAVAACTKLDLPLTVIGNGPDHKKLRKMAGLSINFVTDASDEDVANYFASAEAFIFPGIDDFGIVAVEAMAADTPVIAFGGGGALDYVTDSTGILFNDQTVESLAKALQSFTKKTFNHSSISSQAAKFSPEVFIEDFTRFIHKNVI